MFQFNDYQQELSMFILECVVQYLDDSNPAVRKAASKAATLLFVGQCHKNKVTQYTIREIIDKCMTIVLSDPEDEVRETMLASLNENFNPCLNNDIYIKQLQQLTDDDNKNIQNLAIVILCRISSLNPFSLVPFLQKMLFQTISTLTYDSLQTENGSENQVQFLQTLIQHGPEIVKPHFQLIINIMLEYLNDKSIPSSLMSLLLDSLTQLLLLSDDQIMLYINQILPIVIHAMQDKSYTPKREAAVRSMVKIIKHTGYVVIPYYKYPDLQESILALLKPDINQDIRYNCLQLIGFLGAIDISQFRKVYYKLEKWSESDPQKVEQIIQRTLKSELACQKKIQTNQITKTNLEQLDKLYKYYLDIMILQREHDIEKQKFLHLTLIHSDLQMSQSNDKTSASILDAISRKIPFRKISKASNEQDIVDSMPQSLQVQNTANTTSSIQGSSGVSGQAAQLISKAQSTSRILNTPNSQSTQGHSTNLEAQHLGNCKTLGEEEKNEQNKGNDTKSETALVTGASQETTNPLVIQDQLLLESQIDIEKLLEEQSTIEFGNPDYYCSVTIKVLLKILIDSSLHIYHDQVLDTISSILSTLSAKAFHHLPILVPVLSNLVSLGQHCEKALRLIETIVRLCGVYYSQEYIDPVIKIFLEQASNQGYTHVCFDILIALIEYCKPRLYRKVEPFILKMNTITLQMQDHDLTKKSLTVYSLLSDLLDDYLQIAINYISQLNFSMRATLTSEIKQEMVKLIVILVNSCRSMELYLGKIVSILLKMMDQCNNQSYLLMNQIVNSLVIIIKKYQSRVVLYIPQINNYILKYQLMNNEFQQIINYLLTYGNLDAFPSLPESSVIFQCQNQDLLKPFTIEQTDSQALNHQIDIEALLQEFNTDQKMLPEDWIEWIRKVSVELIKQNPNPAISHCLSLAEVYPEISPDIFNIAFGSVWCILNEQQKRTILAHLNKIMDPQHYNTIPTHVQRVILNLTEFMQHDEVGLKINNQILWELAEHCQEYQNELYFLEQEFEIEQTQVIDNLITLYTKLGQKEAASGLIKYAKTNLNIDVQIKWQEKLKRWDLALKEYIALQDKYPDKDYFTSKMGCMNAMSEWETIIREVDIKLQSQSEQDQNNVRSVIHLAANAAMNLNQWEKLDKYVDLVPESNNDRSFWNAVIQINKNTANSLQKAGQYIKSALNQLDTTICNNAADVYNRNYDHILKIQQLIELQEIIEFKEFENIYKASEQNDQTMNQELINKKKRLIEVWTDRLIGNPRYYDKWQKIFSVRALLLSKIESVNLWLKFNKLANKQNQQKISIQIIESLKDQFAMANKAVPPKLQLAIFEVMYYQGHINELELCEQECEFLEKLGNNNADINDKAKAKCYLKLGDLLKEKTEKLSNEQLEKILSMYNKSFEFNENYHKTWHSSAILHLDAAKFFKDSKDLEEGHISEAMHSLIKSISLGENSSHISKYIFQDTLRLLSIIFSYGEIKEIYKKFSENFKQIGIKVWIEVVPQIIARLSTPNYFVSQIIQNLLVHISQFHPQALIYPLTVATQSTDNKSADMAIKILEKMKEKPETRVLVEQALLISQELNKVAILPRELWYSQILEALVLISHNQKEYAYRILSKLNEQSKQDRLSLSQQETSFFQTYGNDIREAEQWFSLFMQQKQQESIMIQALGYYYDICVRCETEQKSPNWIYLDNVSPKLLQLKNCDIAIPGSYKPNKPIIKITCFKPRLPILVSKQHPRKIFIFGSDNKEYHFLLKGKEDIRLDERVMQLLALVNRLLKNNPKTARRNLLITRYCAIPLAAKSGLIGWVQNCDTLTQLVTEYRANFKIPSNIEFQLQAQFCTSYAVLPLVNKVEIFRYILENTKAQDLQKVLWLKSPNSEVWLERRTNYTRSLATMSIIGYIVGLGDRHLSNIMLQRQTGQIVHIDFGDCFEVTQKREKAPEKFPFRLTRMLTNVMESCGIEGNYRHTCELVMNLVRANKESLLALLEAFVHDPLINWRLVTPSKTEKAQKEQNVMTTQKQDQACSFVQACATMVPLVINKMDFGIKLADQHANEDKDEKEEEKKGNQVKDKKPEDKKDMPLQPGEIVIDNKIQQIQQEQPKEVLNQKAIEAVERIRNKLLGRDFKENQALSTEEQVNQLILQAMSHENLCQAYHGWNPYW